MVEGDRRKPGSQREGVRSAGIPSLRQQCHLTKNAQLKPLEATVLPLPLEATMTYMCACVYRDACACMPVHLCEYVCVPSGGKAFPAHHLTHHPSCTQRPAGLAQGHWDSVLPLSEKSCPTF